MNRNLYSKELKRNRMNLFIWTCIVLVFTVLVLSLFPYMKDLGDEMASMLNQLPKGLTRSMGLNDQTFNTILGMYNTYYSIYIVVLLSIYAASTGANIISKEERDKTSEFLLTKPISRKNIFLSKIAVLFTLVFTAYFFQSIIAMILVGILGEDSMQWSVFFTMHIHGLVLIIFFTCIGLCLSMWLKPRKNFMGMVVGIVFGTYFLGTIAKVTEEINWIGFISPFHYLDFAVNDLTYDVNYLAIVVFISLGLLLLFSAYKLFEQKDFGA